MMSATPLIDQPHADEIPQLAGFFLDDMKLLGFTSDRPTMEAVTRDMMDDDKAHLRVARSEGDLVGVLLATEFISIKFPGRALWLEELYVAPEARRLGVGRLLVENLVDWAYERGFAGIELEAYRMNTAASILYRSLGFKRLARERYTFDMREYELEEDDP